MGKEVRPVVDDDLIQKVHEKFAETRGMTPTGVIDWALRYLLKEKW